MPQFARIAGGLGTLFMYLRNVKSGMDVGALSLSESAVANSVGYDIRPGADNSLDIVFARLLGTYWPALVGELGHQVIGNPKGAWGTGIGMKLNAATPKGMNL